MMTCARFNNVKRFRAGALAIVMLALMSSGHPSGQVAAASTAVNFDGTNDYITFGSATGASGLNATDFTLELWFKWTGGGVTATTGTGGLTAAIPLLTKGFAQGETPLNINMNYFLGISGGKLAADFEDTINGGNHPVTATTTITTNVWHHAAVTYSTTTDSWSLYLDGVLDNTPANIGNFTPEFTSIQHAGIGTTINSTGTTAGFFAGVIDEARIWNVVRTAAEISANKNLELTSGTGLIGRWGLNEGTGLTAVNSIVGRPNGTLANGPTWVVPDLVPPAAPQNVGASIGNALVTLAWNANTEPDLAGYNVYRNGSGTPLNATPLTSPIFTDSTVTNGVTYTYTVKAIDASSNPSDPSLEVMASPNVFAGAGMQFNGSSQYVTFGPAVGTGTTGLGAQTFTLETWFKRTGAGIATTTGTLGISDAIPLVAKGMAEGETPANVNMNYFLGIRLSTGRLVADFEDTAGGVNHPVEGTTPIPISTTVWHHAAATYDGINTWRLYLDGNLDATLVLAGAFTPEFTSIQHATIGTALDSDGNTVAGTTTNPQGFFNGLLDEVRIWNYARTQSEIQATMNQEVFVGPIGRWGLNEATGSTVASSARAIPGTAVGTPRWTAGYPFPPDVAPPAAPVNLSATAGNGQVALAWTANTEGDLAGYNLYRRTTSTTFGAPLNGGTLLTSPAYLDTTVTNETEYFYAVSAADVFNNVSGLSNEASATPSTNPPPAVNAGLDRVITLSSFATLSGSASDNGPFGVLWTAVSGPGAVTFADEISASTTATFTQTGPYVLRLTANDGEKTAFDDMTVTVTDPVLVGAGDIAPDCGLGDSQAAALATGTLLDTIPGAVFTLGDNAYTNGTAAQFANCYEPAWGRHKARTRPVAGNHDYNTLNATGYYDYFNGAIVLNPPAGDRTKGYYSYNLGNWHIVVLNSECPNTAPSGNTWLVNGCEAGSAQEQWLRTDLAASPTNNIIAMWHKPLYSSSGGLVEVQPLWKALYDYGADIWLGGHWHNYEHLLPMNADGASDPAFGIRAFVVGTGGVPLTTFGTTFPTSVARNGGPLGSHGVMKLTLHDTTYDWEFIPAAGSPSPVFTDSGTGTVHGAPVINGAPTANAQTLSTNEDVALGITLTGSDPEGAALTFAPGTPSHGTLSGTGATRIYTPAPNYNGSDSFTFTASDGSLSSPPATVSITVTPVNDAPTANGQSVSTTQNVQRSITMTGSDPEGTALTFSPGAPSHGTLSGTGATRTYTPTAGYTGPDSFTFTANDGGLTSPPATVSITVSPIGVQTNYAIDFGGTDAYVTFGAAPGLGVSTMTIEAWFRRDGAGAGTSTGTGGFNDAATTGLAIPLITKGRAQSDGSNVDTNYFLGINTLTNVLVGDFEDFATGLNHPVSGTTPIPISTTVWHHAAATYDGTTWRLYLDGALETTSVVGNFTPRFDSIQHASIGSALQSSVGSAAGFFDGVIDEARIWGRALSQAELQANINLQITSGSNLVARWGLNENTGTAVNDSTPSSINGVITGANYAWTAGAPFNLVITALDPVLVGAGDIAANCIAGDSTANAAATATLLEGIPGTVFTLGDNAYLDGTAAQFANCYGPTWGRPGIKARTRPTPGNHDYNTLNATGYYDYFNGAIVQDPPAGDRTKGYYSYNLGNWHIVVLNSECPNTAPSGNTWLVNGCEAGSAQEQWLRTDLAASPTNNIIAMWHKPLYSSTGGLVEVQPLWQALYEYGADIWLGGHWHNYERLAPMNADGASDPAFGIRSFVVGTGGTGVTSFGTMYPTSEVRNATTFGVIKFTLHDASYDWQFIPIVGQTFTDSGTSTVHGAPPGNQPPVVDAGPDQTVPSGAAFLSGSVTDDGATTVTWSQSDGPATAIFGNPNAASTSVGFPMAGVYVLRLTASDGVFDRFDELSVIVTSASGNLPPIVDAGLNQSVTPGTEVSLAGTITDDGLPGTDVTTIWSKFSGPGTVTFDDATSSGTTAIFSATGTYVLRLTANDGELSGFDDLTVTVQTNSAIDFVGTNAYVTFGAAPALGVSTMTIEGWFRRDGAGVATSTGSGGMTAIPLITKGMAEDDTPANVNMNYFLGIRSSDNVLGADFEDTATGLNHPAFGVTPITNGVWHHAAATYDGTTWRLYLDGVLENTFAVGSFTPQFNSIQHAVIGSALDSDGNTVSSTGSNTQGFFNGAIDEVRIWNRALSLTELQSNINQQIITSPPNLVARWGLNEGIGTAVNDPTVSHVNGTITGANYEWTAGAPFNLTFNQAPNQPLLNNPSNGATGQSTSPTLSVSVSDPDIDPLAVTFYGRAVTAGSAPDFTLVALPDTQHYSDDATRAATFTAQTQWIVSNRGPLNIPFVTHLGDIVEHIDAVPVEWQRAKASMSLLHGQVPYGLAPGNHDMNSAGVATNYDLNFPVSLYEDPDGLGLFPWYGGYLGKNLFGFTDPIDRQYKNNFELFSVGGLDFIIIHLEYDMPGYAVDWANRVLAAYPNRRAIISTHLFLTASGERNPAVLNRPDGTPASLVWTNLIVPKCNVFLVLNGHYPGEANRTDPTPSNPSCPNRTVHQLESDYQSRPNGGEGFLRYMTFKPAENKIYVYTFSPTLNSGLGQFETDANSQFVLDYNMQGVPFTPIATNTNVTSGNTTTSWSGRTPNTQYEWYATVGDGMQTVTGPTWTFTTAATVNQAPTATNLSAAETYTEETALNLINIVVSDVDSASVTATLTLSNIAAGSLNTGTSGSVTSTYNASTGVWSASGAVANVNTLLAALTFTPTLNFNSNFTIATSVSDGVAAAVTGSKPMTGTAVNDAPTATNLSAAETYTEDVALNLTDIVVSDVDSANVTATLTLSNVSAGSLNTGTSGTVTSTFTAGVWSASGVLANVNALLAGLTFTPVNNFNASFTIATSVSDGVAAAVTGSKTMTGTAVNDAPTATNLSAAETYTEDVALNLIDIVVSDVDSASVTATLTLSNNGAAGSLNTGTSGSVTSTYNTGTGVWSASGALANVNALLAGLTFTPAGNFTSGFTIATSVSDGVAPAVTGSKTMTGTAVNDAPTATNLSAAETYTEETPLNLIDIVVSDVDSASVTATLTLSNNGAAGSLNTGTSGSVTSTYNTGTGVWSASGALANVNALLAGLTFTPALNFTSGFTIATSVSDGVAPAVTGSKTMTGTAVNDAPTATNLSAAETYTEETPLNLIDIVVSDVDSASITATLTLSNNGAAGSLNTGTSGSVTSTYNTGTGVWSASGALANVNALLAGLTFTPALNFTSGFTIATSVSDGVAPAVTGSKTMTGTAVNDAPTATNLSAAETYTEDVALNLIDIVVSDVDSASVTATLTLSNNGAAGSLNTGTSGTVTSTYNAGTGVWSASGALANVNALLAGLTFTPAGNFTSGFTIATSVSDGVAPAVTGSKTMTGTAVNDAPTATNLSAAETYTEETPLNLIDIVVSDVDSASITATLTLSNNGAAGSLNTGTSGSVTSTYNTGTGVWSASGALANVNALLAGLTFTPALNFTSGFTIATSVSDGVAPAVTGSKTMTGTAVNDAPTATNLSAAETYTEDVALNLIDIVVSDVDSASVTATLTLSNNGAAGSLNTGTSGTVTSTYNADTGVWSASGALANVNALLAGLTFTPAGNFTSGFTIATSVSDGVAPAVTGSKTMTGTAVNDAPTATNLSAAETYTEETPLNLIDIVVSDVDSASITATLTLSNNGAAGSLNTGTSGAVTSTYNTGTGVWSASGVVADVNTLLAALTFTPAGNFTSSFTIATSVSDGVAPAVTGSKTMTGTAVNDAPTATNLSTAETYTEGAALNLTDIVVTDVDSPNVSATLTLSNNGAAGSLNTGTSGTVTSTYTAGTGVWSASGALANVNTLLAGLTFTPAANFNSNFTITTSVSDGVAPAVTGSKTMTGTAVNTPPTATNLSAPETYTEETALNLIDIVVSDVDSPNVTATLTLSNNGAAGSLNTGTSGAVTSTYNTSTGVWSASGVVADVNTLLAGLTFTPALNVTSSFTIATSVSDGVAAPVTGSKTMTGTAVNDAPTATNLSTAETYTEGAALNLIDIVVTDVDSASVTATLTLSNNGAAGSLNTGTSGSVTSTYNAGTGVWSASGVVADVNTLLVGLTFTPAANFNSNFTITTSVSDGVAPAVTGSKTMTGTAVNTPPTATNLSAAETYTEGVALNLIDIVVTDADSPNVTATLTLSTTGAGSLNTGTSGAVTSTFSAGVWSASGVLANVNALLAAVIFTPAANFNSSFTITTSVSDGVAPAVTGSKTMTGTAVNTPPTAGDDTTSTNEDMPVTVTQAALTGNDTDTEGTSLTVTAASNATNGTAARNTDGSVTFTPAANFSGTAGFDYTVSDGTLTDTGHVTVTVNGVNDAPLANVQSVSASQNTARSITLTGSDIDGPLALSFTVMSGPSNGTLSGTAPNLTYTPAPGYAGADSFMFQVNDSIIASSPATVSITVSPIGSTVFSFRGVGTHYPVVENTAGTGTGPRAVTPPASLQAGDLYVIVAAYRGTATLSLAGTGGQTWTAETNAQANSQTARVFWCQFNGVWTGTPSVNVTGTSTLTVYSFAVAMAAGTLPEIDVAFASGSHSGGTVTVPSFTTTTAGALALVGWVSADNNAWSGLTTGWSSPGGQTQWRHDANSSDNTISLAYQINPSMGPTGSIARTQTGNGPDNGLYFRIAFRAAAPPTEVPADLTNLAATPTAGRVTLTWTDTATNEAGVSIERCTGAGCTNFVPMAAVGPNVTSYPDTPVAAGTTYRYQVRAYNVLGPSANYSNVADATTAASAAPVAGDDTASTNEDTPVTLTQAVLTGNDTDTNGDSLTVTAAANATNGTAVRNANGSVTFTPAANFNGPAGFDYTVTDGTFTDIGHVTVTVNAVNDAPVANPQSVSTSEDTAVIITLSGTDLEGGSLTFNTGTAQNGTLTGSGNTRTFTPAPNYNGTASFTFRANDGSVNSPAATVSITVTPVYDAPTANSQSVTTEEYAPVNITLTGLNIDGPQPLSFTVLGGPSNGMLSGTAPNLTYVPAPDYAGADAFTFQVNDGIAISNPATVSITVNPVGSTAFSFRGVGTHFPVVENADEGSGPGPRLVTPPASLQAGDLYVIVAAYRGTATLSLAGTGGQTWTAEANAQANSQTVRVFWCQFNGVWNGLPSVTNTTGTSTLSVNSFAVAMAAGTEPAIDVVFASGSHSGGTVTVPTFTTTTAGALALVGWVSNDNNAWSAPPAGWSSPGGQTQWRNRAGSDNTISLAYQINPSMGATGSIARTQTGNGPDNGLYFRLAFKGVVTVPPINVPADLTDLQATAAGGRVMLTWTDTATNEAGVSIERCTGDGCTNFMPIAAVGPNVTSYPDTTVAASTTYRYQVQAYNVLGSSANYSNIADATTPAPPPTPFIFRGVGTHFPVVENADEGSGPGPRAVTPPASLQPGDLYVIVAAYRGTATLGLAQTGGQAWTAEANAQANGQTVRVFWSRFNGSWTANPSVTNTTGTSTLTVYSFAVDVAVGAHPEIDVAFASGSHSGDTVTVPSFTTTTAGALALVGWVSGDNNAWSAPPAGWSTPGGQLQWRNANGSDNSIGLAYQVKATIGATGSIARGQTSTAPDSGLYFRLAWKQVMD